MGSKTSKYKNQPPRRPELRSRDLKFLSQKTGLSTLQVNALFERFFRENTHGELTKQQFIEFYSELRPEPNEQLVGIANHIFSTFDVDKNGLISFNEFLIGYAMTSRGDQREKLSYAFDLYDMDESGYLDINELNTIIFAMFDMLNTEKDRAHSYSLAQLCMKQLDKDGNGQISKDEFVEGLLENYSMRILMSPYN